MATAACWRAIDSPQRPKLARSSRTAPQSAVWMMLLRGLHSGSFVDPGNVCVFIALRSPSKAVPSEPTDLASPCGSALNDLGGTLIRYFTAMFELGDTDPIIKAYLRDIQRLKGQQLIEHELGLKGPFQNLLDKAARKRGWTLVPELSTYSGGKRVVPDGTVRDEFRLARG
jgi:hypothetical protein